MSDSHFDVIIIGAGPGGYVCAIRCAQLGLKTAIVEKRGSDAGAPKLGGTCLNVGCIPSKALLDSSERVYELRAHGAEHGITVGDVGVDIPAMMKRKDTVVSQLVGGVSGLMKKNKVTVLAGLGSLVGDKTVQVTAADDSTSSHTADAIVLATGSTPIELPFLPIDGEHIVTSDHAIAFEKIPDHLVIVGGGVIGVELGSVWARLGAKVTVLEFLDRITPGFDLVAAKGLQKSLQKIGIAFELGTKVTGASIDGDTVTVTAEKGDQALELSCDKLLVAVGRRPVTEGLGLDAAGVKLDDRGRVAIDHEFKTSADGIYAIGDLVPGAMLAHKAEEEGVALAEILAGERAELDHDLIPGVVYTEPELASVGIGADAAKERGLAVKTGTFSFMANGRAKAAGINEGFVSVVADKETDRLLGVTILGPRASDLIAEAAAIMQYAGSAEDLARMCHAHPTFSEAVKEAALASQGRVIHS